MPTITHELVVAAAVRRIPDEQRTREQRALLVRADRIEARLNEVLRHEETERILRASEPDAAVPVLSLRQVRTLCAHMRAAEVSRIQQRVLLLRVGWERVVASYDEHGDVWEWRHRDPLPSSPQIAGYCAVTPGTVRQWLMRGRDRMAYCRPDVMEVMTEAAGAMVSALANPLGKQHHGSGKEQGPARPEVAERAEAWLRYWYGDE